MCELVKGVSFLLMIWVIFVDMAVSSKSLGLISRVESRSHCKLPLNSLYWVVRNGNSYLNVLVGISGTSPLSVYMLIFHFHRTSTHLCGTSSHLWANFLCVWGLSFGSSPVDWGTSKNWWDKEFHMYCTTNLTCDGWKKKKF